MNDLHAACNNNKLHRVKELLASNAFNIDDPDDKGWAPLTFAARAGNCEVIRLLLRGGATVEVGEPLHFAAFGGKLAPFIMLVEAGAKLENPDAAGRVALDIASMEGHYDVVNWILSHTGIARCGGESKGGQALWRAACGGHVEVMQLLMKFNVFSPYDLGKALLEAVHFSQEKSVKFLLKFDGSNGLPYAQQALIWAVNEYMEGCASSRITRQLMDAGASPTQPTSLQDESGAEYYDTALGTVAKLKEEETDDKHVKRLDAIHRLLRQVDAVHSLSFLWPLLPSPSAPTSSSSSSSTPSAVVVHLVRRSKEATSRVVKGALFRYAQKTMDTEVKNVKDEILGEALKLQERYQSNGGEVWKEYREALRNQPWWPKR